jgi:hypothetical protein
MVADTSGVEHTESFSFFVVVVVFFWRHTADISSTPGVIVRAAAGR